MLIRSPRARTLLLAAVAILLVGIAAFFLFRQYLPVKQPGLELPSSLPSFVQPSGQASGSPGPAAKTLVAVGDIGSCNSQADEAVAQLVDRLGGAIASLGDTVYETGSDQEFAQCFAPAWGPMKSRIHPAVGNHEYETDGAAGYYDYFGSAAGGRGQGWYSYDLGGWHVVVLNSNCELVGCGAGSPQLAWLRQDLSKADASCLMAYWHHPRWSSGRHGSNAFVQPFWSQLERAGVDVILNGHDHDYERISVDGVREFVVGTGGRSLYAWPGRPLATTQTRSNQAYGALWMELQPGGYLWRYVALGGSGFTDAGSGSC
jgi:alkaline phosphatase